MKHILNICALSFALLGTGNASYAAIPAGYYSSCENKGGQELLEALHSTIGNHTTVSYSALYDLYKTSDVYPEDGKIWDMYSTKHWDTGKEECGSYKKIGDCYNREHSFPKSWFDNKSPMSSDAFHIYPTDGKVNGQRSNNPYGECAGGTSVASSSGVKALGKLGKSTFNGYSGTVFEPDDEYKGDFARSYFYMAACYNNRIASWHSDMLAGNSYPAFREWAVELLLKWDRQDPVSQKEIDRNEAVYSRQHNRNPFIDHPELAQYIWGDKKNLVWSGSEEAVVTINRPADGSEFFVGTTGPGIAVTAPLSIKTTNATGTVTINLAGTGFKASTGTISAAAANKGTNVNITYTPDAVGGHSATLAVTAGSAKAVVILKGSAISGIPASAAADVTDNSFTARWTYVGDDRDGKYALTVSDAEGVLDGYPVDVDAKAGAYTVEGLAPLTDYTYSLAGESIQSHTISVKTGEAVRSVDFLFDGDLYFATAPGVPSPAAEIFIVTQNIESDITVSVDAPFELSVDNTSWSTSITLSPDEDRMYMRLNSSTAGSFETAIRAESSDFVTDDAFAQGVATASPGLFEDFETVAEKADNYENKTYTGTACKWNITDAGIWKADGGHDSIYSLRMGKTSKSALEMAEDCLTGIGDISFYAQRWTAKEGDVTVAVEYSTDGGASWRLAGNVTVTADSYSEYRVHAGVEGKARMRIRQTDGGRFNIDDISLSRQSSGLDEPEAERHQWNAYSHSGNLYIDVTKADGIETAVYALDGTTVFAGRLCEGTTAFALTSGTIVIVATGDFSRTVLIR